MKPPKHLQRSTEGTALERSVETKTIGKNMGPEPTLFARNLALNSVTVPKPQTDHYENTSIQIYRKFYLQKLKKKTQVKNSDIFHISAPNINCGYLLEPPRRGGSNEYSQSMFLSRNKTYNVYPCKPVLLYKSGVLRGQNYIGMSS